jgi:hypothetical protein
VHQGGIDGSSGTAIPITHAEGEVATNQDSRIKNGTRENINDLCKDLLRSCLAANSRDNITGM